MHAPLRRFLVVGLTLFVLAAWQTAQQEQEASAAEPKKGRITTKKEYITKVVGKKLTSGNGVVYSHKDGTLTGYFGEKEMTGTWTWEEGYWCRTVIIGGREFPHDCQVVTVLGDKLTFIRDRGEGAKIIYLIDKSE